MDSIKRSLRTSVKEIAMYLKVPRLWPSAMHMGAGMGVVRVRWSNAVLAPSQVDSAGHYGVTVVGYHTSTNVLDKCTS